MTVDLPVQAIEAALEDYVRDHLSHAKTRNRTMADDLTVRLTVVGHASKRWLGASNAAEAERLNRALSETRAQNLRKPVEDIIRKELPGVKIEVPAKGVGRRDGFPLTGEDNAPIDRSVVVMIELVTTQTGSTTQFRPSKLHVPSKFWTLKVVSMVRIAGGVAGVFMRVIVRNVLSGHELTLAGYLYGGYYAKVPFDVGGKRPSNPKDTLNPSVTWLPLRRRKLKTLTSSSAQTTDNGFS